MAEMKPMRLSKVLKEFNISFDRAAEFFDSKGLDVEARPNTKIGGDVYQALSDEFATDKSKKAASKEIGAEKRREQEELRLRREREQEEKQRRDEVIRAKAKLDGPKQVGNIDLEAKTETPAKETPKESEASPKEEKKSESKKETPTVQETPQATETPQADKTPKTKETSKAEETAKVEEAEAEDVPKGPQMASNRPQVKGTTIKGKIDLDSSKKKPKKSKATKPTAKKEEPKKEETKKEETKKAAEPVVASDSESNAEDKKEKGSDVIKTEYKKLEGLKITGKKIDLSKFESRKKEEKGRRKRKRISKNSPGGRRKGGGGRKPEVKEELTEEQIQKQVRETLEKLQGKSKKSKSVRNRREKRDIHRERREQLEQEAAENKVLEVTEFVPVNDLATMMDVTVSEVIGACMSLGIMVTMNQRLDAETMTVVAEEFGYEVEFLSAEIEESIAEVEDADEDLLPRAPIVTVMGHVDHGKTSLLDHIRSENVIAGESGGITQHIGAYNVMLESGQNMTFLDTPGHEAFTAMRARGAQVTDIAIIVIAADDDVMPQTKEAISHAQAAGVPIVFAINKVDRDVANPEKIKESLANMNLLVEDWGGKIQSHDISAKTGMGVDELLEKVLLEAELLDLKANPDKFASGTVVEAFLDKGRGYVSTILVQSGTLRVGDYLLAGGHHGKIRAMEDERGKRIQTAGPATPVSVLGLDGAPQAGDKFNVFEDEREAKDIAGKRTQLQREQSVRTQKRVTLDKIGQRIAQGNYQELNIILKGDVDGSVEALTDSFQKLSTEEIEVKIVLKGVGAITESDVLLATASDAIIIGFNVRPQGNAREVAEREDIEIRTYSIIYDAINDLRDAMEGMLSPELKEEITGNAEVRQLFKISKIGTIAGCMVTDGKIYRNSGVRIIREGVVVHTGELDQLKRFKDDVKEVAKGYECGIQIKNFNDLKELDVIESFREVEVKKTLS